VVNLILSQQSIISREASVIPMGVTPPASAVDIIYSYPTIAALMAGSVPASNNVTRRLLGCLSAGDAEMPLYRWDVLSTATHDGALVVKPNSVSAASPGRYLAIHNNRINVKWFGAIGDNTNDDGPAITNALAASVGRTLVFPKGVYRVFQVVVPSGTTIEGQAGAEMAHVGGYCFIFQVKTGLTISGLRFRGTNTQIAVFAGKSSNITIKNCSAECRLFAGELHSYTGVVSETDYNRNVRILNNDCVGTDPLIGDAAIYFIYCDGAIAKNNTVKNYAHGIAWWGGGAGPTDNGDLANERKTKNIKIINNTVSNIGGNNTGGGGIWGSMGKNVIVSGNNISNCEDVGIDFEGTFNGVAVGNTVTDCIKGCLATFFWNQEITFANNIVQVTNSNYPVWRNYNVSQEGSKSNNIQITNNQFLSTGTAVGLFDCQGGSCSDLKVIGNKFKNVYISIDAANMGAVTIEDNEILVTIQANNRAGISVVGIVGEKELLRIEGNKVESKASQPVGSTGIFVNHNHFNSPQISVIKNNICYGFLEDITCVLTSANASIGGTFILQNNIGTAGVISVARAVNAGVAPTSLKLNNMRFDGVAS
jgi:hypothetical protein